MFQCVDESAQYSVVIIMISVDIYCCFALNALILIYMHGEPLVNNVKENVVCIVDYI